MRKIVISAVLISVLLAGCIVQTRERYTFRQEFDQIKTIEILKKAYDSAWIDVPLETVRVIDSDEFQEITSALLEIDGGHVHMSPNTDFGYYLIQITYKNGEIELIGDGNNGYISIDGRVYQDTYCFNREQFYDLISRFLGETVTEPTLG